MTLNIPGNLIVQDIPAIPHSITERLGQYLQSRSAMFCDWAPDGQGLMISTRFGQTYQLHHVRQPGGARKQITFFKEPVYAGRYCQAPGHNGFVYSLDTGGAEYYQIYYYDLDNGQRKLLTDGTSKNGSPLWSHQGTLMAYSSTARNERDHDIYLNDIQSPDSARLVCKVQGLWAPVAWSPDNQKLLLLDYISATETYYHLLDLNSGDVELLFPKGDPVAYGDAVWSQDGQGIYFIADIDSEFMHLHYVDLATREVQGITRHIPWNVTELSLAPQGDSLAFTVNEDGWGKLYLLDVSSHEIHGLDGLNLGIASSPCFSPDGQHIAFTLHDPTTPGDIFSVAVQTGNITRWTESEVGGLNTSRFPRPSLIRYASFDNREIPAFYYRPEQNSDRPYPVIISIHGGPESQYRPGFSALFQYWLNELDIAVIAPNVRGSTGYGKTYIKLDNGYLREDSVKDIGALLDWIAEQPELDEKRVCVYGGSYGGYMVLASLMHFSDRLRCGIDMVGISNFVTFLKNTKAYRRDLRRVEYGDERDPKMAAFLNAISPTTNAHRIQRPLMVAQGYNDPRVPASEAEQIVETVRANGMDVWYLLAMDEGHGFHKQVNLEYYYAAMSLFLERYLLD
jgi:dipeptidyl aminopeptidase/acylaminoacyl peptidase